MGAVLSGVGSFVAPIASKVISSYLTPSPGTGTSPVGNLISGAITSGSNRPPSQTQPGAFYPPSGSGTAYNYIPTGQLGADIGAQGQLGYNAASGLTAQELANPMLATLLRSIMNNPASGGFMGAAQNAGNISGSTVPGLLGSAGQITDASLASLPGLQALLKQGMDPQNALYDRTLQQVRDQMGAGLSQTGLTGGQAGAVENQGISNFNIDWQNQQLQRMLQAMSGYGSGLGTAAGGLQTGAGLQDTAVQRALGQGSIPFAGQAAIFGQQQQGLNDYLQGAGGSQVLGSNNFADLLRYLQVGQQGNQLANNQAVNASASAGLSPLISAGIGGLADALKGVDWSSIFGGSGSPTAPGADVTGLIPGTLVGGGFAQGY